MAAPARIIEPWLSAPATRAVFDALTGGGFRARAVGGIVRNSLLGLPATDIDIATDARPDDTLRLAVAAGLRTIPTGLAHGTVTILSGGVPYEVTTLRRDVATDGRHAEVAFTADWAADAARRDFTINALYCDGDGTVFDPLGGLADLDPVRVRFIGDARCRIGEDYLRILRFFRFSAIYTPDGQLDATGLAACLDLRAGLKRISGERIAAELFKLLAARRGVEVMRAVVKGSLFGQIADVVPRWDDLARLAAIETHLGHPGSADPVLRLAALAAASDDDCLKLDGRLKLSAHDRERMRAVIADAALINPDMGEARARQVLYRLGQRYRDAVLFKWARSTQATDDAGFTQLARLPERWPIPVYPLSGRDALACGLIPGPVIGQRLKAVEDEWVASGFSLDRARLLERLRLG